MLKFHANCVSATQSGDYFQVLFEEEYDIEESFDIEKEYFLIQRQFEFPDKGECYIENRDESYIGHYRIKYAELEKNRFYLEIQRSEKNKIEIFFHTSDHNYMEIKRVMSIMIPELVVNPNIDTM